MSLKQIIFDIDMTLLDSSRALTASVNIMAREFGLPEKNEAQVRKAIGNDLKGFWRELWGYYDPRWHTVYRQKIAAREYEAMSLFPDTLKVVAELHRRGCRLGVASNRERPWDILEAKGLAPYFLRAGVRGLEEGVGPKPDPTMLLNALAGLRAKPEETLFVGDSNKDVEAANKVGVKTLALTTGGHPAAYLKSSGAWRVGDSLGCVLDCLDY